MGDFFCTAHRLEFSRVAAPFNSSYSSEPTLIFKCLIISIVSEFRRAYCCVSSYQSNSRSCASTTRVGVKVQMRQFLKVAAFLVPLEIEFLLYVHQYQTKSPLVCAASPITDMVIRIFYTFDGGLSRKIQLKHHVTIKEHVEHWVLYEFTYLAQPTCLWSGWFTVIIYAKLISRRKMEGCQ